jgi:hypothetical protein
MKKIVGIIDRKTGRITLTPEGYTGNECIQKTAPLEKGLGLKEPERELTADYYTQTEQTQELGGS